MRRDTRCTCRYDAEPLIRRIHNAGKQFVLAFTGGGSGAIPALLRVPGGSQSVLEAVVPYSQAALTALLGSAPEQFCSDRTARAMAMACWLRARNLAPRADPDNLVGLGCTASLASDRPKKGPHRAFLAIQTAWKTAGVSIELTRDARSRGEEEDLVAALALNLVAEAAGLTELLELPLLPGEQVQRQASRRSHVLARLAAWANACGFATPIRSAPPRAIFPGAFNPLHHGHREMAEWASFRLNVPVAVRDLDRKRRQAAVGLHRDRAPRRPVLGSDTLWLTRAPTFAEKSRLFPGATFLVGADTIVRIGQPRYYGNDPHRCEAAIREIAANGCRFLVFPRADHAELQSLQEVELPPALRELCDGVSPVEFRVDISSTQLRPATPTADRPAKSRVSGLAREARNTRWKPY